MCGDFQSVTEIFFFLLIKDKENFSNKENCFVANPAGDFVFMPDFILFFKFLTTEFNTTIFFSKMETSRVVLRTLPNKVLIRLAYQTTWLKLEEIT